MKKKLLFAGIIVMAAIFNLTAQKKVAYITFVKTMDATATTVQNDPVIQMLNADPNLQVTVKALTSVAATDVIADLSTYDVIIVQESFSGSAGMLMPAGALALKTIPKPCVYNKTYAFKSGRALTSSSATGGKESSSSLKIKLVVKTSDLFKACTTEGTTGDSIKLFNALAADAGSLTTSAVKAINYSDGNVISGSSTILALPNTTPTTPAICFNDIPAGSTIDSETTASRIITFGLNFGAICANAGKNITDNGLTIWRNAVYILAGLTVPDTKATLPTGTRSVENSSLTITQSSDALSVLSTENIDLSIYSASGQRVSHTVGTSISTNSLANGVYVLKMTNGNGMNQTYKFMK